MKGLKRFFKILRNLIFIFIGLLAILAVLLNTAPVQAFLTQQASDYLSKKLNTIVAVRNLRIHFFNNASLEGLYIADQHRDTLLYAGDFQIRLTDWVFGGKEKTIHFVGLKDAKIYLHRFKNKNEWNYQFLENAFGSGASSSGNNKKLKLELALKKVKLENVHFYWKDEWVGTDYEAFVGSLLLFPNSIDLVNRKISLDLLKGDQLLFGIKEYTGGRPPRPHSGNRYPLDTTPFNPKGWRFSLAHLKLSNSRFYLDWPQESTPVGLFDEDHLNITGIHTDIKNIRIVGDTVFGHVSDLAAKERCGLTIRKMHADISVSPILSECKNLYLQTNNSTVTDYYAMHYSRFPDFIDYIDKVRMVGNLKNSEIGIQDIAYFAPELNRFAHLSVAVSGNGSGTVSRLSGKNISLNDGFTTLQGNLLLDGLPNVEQTYIDFRDVVLHTSGAAALFYAPELKQQQAVHLEQLTSIDFSGNYTGFIRDFVAYGKIQTNLGNIEADLNMKLPKNEKAQYSGNLRAANFASGVLLNQQTVGNTSFAIKVNGVGFNPKTLSAKIEGNVSSLVFNQYNYQNISVNGAFDKQLFNGTLSINDSNASFDFDGKIDFSKERPLYHFDAVVNQLHFKPLHFTQDSVKLRAELQIDMEGNQLDNLTGNAFLTNVNLLRNGKRLNIDALKLSSNITNNGFHQIDLKTNNATAQLKGQFYPSDLLNSVRMYLSYYLPEYILPPDEFGRSHSFEFQINAGNISDLISLVQPNVQLKGAADISGIVDLEDQSMNLQGTVSQFAFGKIASEQIHFKGLGDLSGLQLHLDAQNVTAGSDNILSEFKLSTHLFRDTANFQIETTSPGTIDKASLNGLAIARQDSLYMKLTPSQFNFNNEVWKIPSGNTITFADKYISIKNLLLQSGAQKIEINPKGSEQRGNNAFVKLKDINISPLNSFINLYGNKLNGLINGTIHAFALLDTSRFEFDLKGTNVTLQQDSIGTIHLKGNYSIAQGKIRLIENSGIHNNNANLSLLGTIDLHKKDSVFVNGKVLLDQANLSWVAPFLEGYVHDIKGNATGVISFTGAVSQLKSKGLLSLDHISFSPDLTGVHYNIPKSIVRVSNSMFHIDSTVVYDESENTGLLSGNIAHQGFKDFYFNLKMTSNKIKVINQSQFQSNYFYGNIDAKVNMTIRGSWEDLTMHLIANPLPGSKLFLTVDYSSDLGAYKYISFRQKNKQNNSLELNYGNKFNFILDAVVNPDLETTLILDPQTGDQIWAKGNGNIILEIPSEGQMKMNGNYIISEGTYNFSFQQLQVLNYKRQFVVDAGSSIKWNGGITDADLDVTAHTTVKARLYDLISNEIDRLNLSKPETYDAQLRQNVDVLMYMKGSLNKPELSFKMQLAEGRSIGTYAYQKLQRINTDEKQTLIQVSSLLLLGQFVPPEGINSSAISSGTINNMSELVSSVASSQITNLANKLLGMQDLSVGVQYKNYSMSEANPLSSVSYFNRNEAQVNLRKNFLKDRLMVEVGGVYDWGQAGSGGNYTANLAGDFRIQYLLTQDGRVRFSIFRTSDYDPLYSLKAIGRQGVNLSYRKSFNNFHDFFTTRNWSASATKPRTHNTHTDSTHIQLDPIKQKLLKEAITDSTVSQPSFKKSGK